MAKILLILIHGVHFNMYKLECFQPQGLKFNNLDPVRISKFKFKGNLSYLGSEIDRFHCIRKMLLEIVNIWECIWEKGPIGNFSQI